jgi:hypothetical protein
MNYQAIAANHFVKSGNKKGNLLSLIILFIFSFVLTSTFGYSASTPAVSLSTSRITFSSYSVGSTSGAQPHGNQQRTSIPQNHFHHSHGG